MDDKIINIKDHRKSLSERIDDKKAAGKELPDLIPCTKCENVLFYLVFVREEDVNVVCAFCQHCGEPMGIVDCFDEDEDG